MHRIRVIIHDCKQVYEVSETASDAWSTDVLASDTSERPCDRLSELDQDDVAPLSTPNASLEPVSDNDFTDQPLIGLSVIGIHRLLCKLKNALFKYK